QFFLYTFGNYSPALTWMKTISIFNYWGYAAGLIDGAFRAGAFIVLSALSAVLLTVVITIFQKRDAPSSPSRPGCGAHPATG
ncbi:MAG: hypothetical protein ACP5EK_07190, partial [Thermoplasmatota archaeon]